MQIRHLISNPTKDSFFRAYDQVQRRFLRQPKVASVDSALDLLTQTQNSFVRFGDGEVALMRGRGIRFQNAHPELQKKLVEVLQTKEKELAIGIPNAFGDLSEMSELTRRWWRADMGRNRRTWLRYLDLSRQYYDACVTRLYFANAEPEKVSGRFQRFRQVWDQRNVLVVEGDGSRVGVGNDLLSNAKSVLRIVCPSKNAFTVYGEILSTASAQPKDRLVLIALGPTAKALTLDLHQQGFRAVDIGHLDVEYEWFLRGATRRIPIPGKHVNEAYEGEDFGEIESPEYLSQIIARIGQP